MKQLAGLLLVFFLPGLAAGQKTKPELIYPLTIMAKSPDYYRTQALLWEQEVDQRPEDANAWFNYYKAARNANVLALDPDFSLGAIVKELSGAIPHTFEHYYIEFWESPLENRRYDLLLKAHELAPDRIEAYHDLITYYELTGEKNLRSYYCQKWYESNAISPGVLDWNYNALMSVESNAILLTQGDNDTYPAWVLQEVMKVQPGVRVLNLYLLAANREYRDRVYRELGLVPQFASAMKMDLLGQVEQVAQHIFEHAKLPVYYGISVPATMRRQEEEHLYLTGLAFLRSLTALDNVAIIRHNVERKFRMDNLKLTTAFDRSQSVVNHMNINYIPPLILLHRHYVSTGESAKATELQQLVLDLAKRDGKEETVRLYFEDQKEVKPFESLIDVKEVDKNMMKIVGNTYASATEVTNELYEQFLMDLVKQKEFDKLEVAKIHPTDWISLIPEEYRDLPTSLLFDNSHPEEPPHPVVNISYEAAEVFCQWLTQVYNQSTYKRKRFRKVRFYLPTEQEWMYAARAGRESVPFPWGGYYYKNEKGCYLMNSNPYLSEYDEENDVYIKGEDFEVPNEDGVFFPAYAISYFPNDYGLYNMSGNVAEMVQEKTFTKGGSWLDPNVYTVIDARHERSLPSPAVGFRMFMEVLEE